MLGIRGGPGEKGKREKGGKENTNETSRKTIILPAWAALAVDGLMT